MFTKVTFICSKMVKTVIFCMHFCDENQNFQHHCSSLQCHMIFRNLSNMLICCSWNIFVYCYQSWKQLLCLMLNFLWLLSIKHFFTLLFLLKYKKLHHGTNILFRTCNSLNLAITLIKKLSLQRKPFGLYSIHHPELIMLEKIKCFRDWSALKKVYQTEWKK